MNKITLPIALLFASSAFAGEHAAKTFDQLDQDQDGQVSAAEAGEDARLSRMWNEIDRDGSGAIDQAEFSAFEAMGEPAAEE